MGVRVARGWILIKQSLKSRRPSGCLSTGLPGCELAKRVNELKICIFKWQEELMRTFVMRSSCKPFSVPNKTTSSKLHPSELSLCWAPA